METLQQIIDEGKNIVFFGGAGVSCESGIPDFRSPDGLYCKKYKYPPEQMLSRTFFDRYKEEFFTFYKDHMIYQDALPNLAHFKLAELEGKGKLKGVITQNIDGLHQKAGSKVVCELHGSVHRNYCMDCHKLFSLDDMMQADGILYCDSCGGIVKPDVVLYEEGLDQETVQKAISLISDADVLIIGGTSLAVYPAASFIDYFRGDKVVVINKEKLRNIENVSLEINDAIGKILGGLN